MSDYINSYLYNFNDDNWKKATENFSQDSINSLFDLNNDGEFTGVEKDRAENVGLLNALDSIHPVVAKAYNDVNFNINRGNYLTEQQYEAGQKFFRVLNEVLNKEYENELVEHRINPQNMNMYIGDLDEQNLMDYLKNRQYLSQQEINNDT